MIRLINILLCILLTTAATAQKSGITGFFNGLAADADLKSASISLKVVNANTKEVLVKHNSHLSLVPASIQKAVTTGLAFLELGNNFRFETQLKYSGEIQDSVLNGNLYIIGGGDPTLASPNLENTSKDIVFSYFLEALQQKGIKAINGKVISEASYFSEDSKHLTWEWADIGTYYGAGIYGLNFEENYFSLFAKTNAKWGDSIVIRTNLDHDISITNRINLVHPDSTSNLNLYSSPLHTEQYYLVGDLAKTGHEIKIDCAMQTPAQNCVYSFTNFLANNNISVLANTLIDSINKLTNIAIQYSPSITEIITHTNFISNNIFAEALAMQLVKANNMETNFTNIEKTIIQLLEKHSLEIDGVYITDGSGLSRHNLVTADFMCNFLIYMNNNYPEFIYCLPIPGENKSTLRNFMNTYKNKTRFNLKSGSMTGVLSYAGYVKNTKGETLCVSLIVNNFTSKVKDVRKKIEKLMSYIPNI